MYSGEYDACDVTLECISTPGKLEKYAWPRCINKNLPKFAGYDGLMVTCCLYATTHCMRLVGLYNTIINPNFPPNFPCVQRTLGEPSVL